MSVTRALETLTSELQLNFQCRVTTQTTEGLTGVQVEDEHSHRGCMATEAARGTLTKTESPNGTWNFYQFVESLDWGMVLLGPGERRLWRSKTKDGLLSRSAQDWIKQKEEETPRKNWLLFSTVPVCLSYPRLQQISWTAFNWYNSAWAGTCQKEFSLPGYQYPAPSTLLFRGKNTPAPTSSWPLSPPRLLMVFFSDPSLEFPVGSVLARVSIAAVKRHHNHRQLL